MAKFVVQNPVIVLNGGTVSSAAAQVTISLEADDVETTNFGSDGWRERIGGLKAGTFDVEWHQDVAAGAIDSVIFPLLGGTVTVAVRPGGTAAIGTSNPQYSFAALCTAWSPIDSAVGDLATVSTSWPITGAVTRGTAA
jgi:hypothetical protein